MLLHTVNKSPFERNALESCLQHAKKGSSVLLIEDGVYGAIKGTVPAQRLREASKDVKIYALAADVETRGLTGRLIDGVTLVDYGGFVDLVTEHTAVQAWL